MLKIYVVMLFKGTLNHNNQSVLKHVGHGLTWSQRSVSCQCWIFWRHSCLLASSQQVHF